MGIYVPESEIHLVEKHSAVLDTRSDFPSFVGRFWVHILLYLKSLWRVLFPSSFHRGK